MRRLCAVFLLLLLFTLPVHAQNAMVTRAQFCTMLWQSLGGAPALLTTAYSDVIQTTQHADAISWLEEQGLISGTGGGCFSPQRPITREEAAVLLRRSAHWLGRDAWFPDGPSLCNDYEGISPWADDSLYWATGIGLIPWSPGGRLDPQGTFSPIQAEAVLDTFSDGPPSFPLTL